MRRAGPMSRDAVFAAVLVGGLALGLVADASSRDLDPPGLEPPPGRYSVTSLHCVPPLKGLDARGTVSVASTTPAQSIEVVTAPSATPAALLPERTVTQRQGPEPLEVVGYGGAPAASATVDTASPEGSGAAACADRASTEWYFAEGSSELGFDQRYVIHNPFPDEAVVRVTMYTPDGASVKANLDDVPVPARSWVELRVNDFVRLQPLLAAKIEVVERGRVVAWRVLAAHSDDQPAGVQLALGAREPSLTWYFPDGEVGAGFDERIAIVNPSTEEAIVNVSLGTGVKTVQPPKLFGLEIPPGSARRVSLPNALAGRQRSLGGVSAVVSSSNGVPVVAERTVWYSTDALRGVASEVGAPDTALEWIVGPPVAIAARDSVIVFNPGTAAVTVDVAVYPADGEARRRAGISVPIGARVEIPLMELTHGRPVVVAVSASGGVVVERVAYSEETEDPAALMGVTRTGR
ncbi:MAG: DUF5719 family protein [Actinomycetota bacterium]